jgi:hypothetical protein
LPLSNVRFVPHDDAHRQYDRHICHPNRRLNLLCSSARRTGSARNGRLVIILQGNDARAERRGEKTATGVAGASQGLSEETTMFWGVILLVLGEVSRIWLYMLRAVD